MNLAGIPVATLDEYFAMKAVRGRIGAKYHKIWLDNGLDALIMPPASTTATPIDEWGPVTYTALWNFLDYPAMILPTGTVQPGDEAESIDNASYGDADRKNYSLCESIICAQVLVYMLLISSLDTGPSDFVNAPLCIQVVGMRQEDERLLRVASVVEEILNNSESSRSVL